MRLLVEPSGEYPGLAKSEILAVCETLGTFCHFLDEDEGAVIVDTDAPPEAMARRLALAWHIDAYEFSCDLSRVEDSITDLEIPGKSFAIRVSRNAELWSGRQAKELAERLGGILAKKAKVDLENPQAEVRVAMSARCHVGIRLASIDRPAFEERRSQKRPFESPVTLHPRLARALLNLSGVRTGETILDPFCGTGGLLIEAATLDVMSVGSDIDPDMIFGCRRNLEHFGVPPDEYRLIESDVSRIAELAGDFDVIVTDPPYGRSATTMKEGIGGLYERAFAVFAEILPEGRKLAVVLPDQTYTKIAEKHFELLSIDEVYVHKSLSRYFCVFAGP